MNYKILVVEDDPSLSMLLDDYLSMVGYNITLASDGLEGWKAFCSDTFDLIILDVMLPHKDGFTLGTQIREKNRNVPFIFLTARNMKDDRINGLKMGADDYIPKPFSVEELKLRIDAIMGRYKAGMGIIGEENKVYNFGRFEFDYNNLLLSVENGESQKLTKKEATLLRLFFLNRNKLIKREVILEQIWGDNNYFFGRSMDVFIAKLRKYLKADENIQIVNVHGTGFRFEVPE